jgi:hypothetical protein
VLGGVRSFGLAITTCGLSVVIAMLGVTWCVVPCPLKVTAIWDDQRGATWCETGPWLVSTCQLTHTRAQRRDGYRSFSIIRIKALRALCLVNEEVNTCEDISRYVGLCQLVYLTLSGAMLHHERTS